MKRRASLLAFCATAVVGVATGSTNLPQKVQHTLTTIDTVPTRAQLDSAFDNSPAIALQNLSSIAADETADTGIRLRAIHAVAKYCAIADACATSDVAHQVVTAIVTTTNDTSEGTALLVLRAGIETMGTMQVASDVTVLVPLLDHPSRDIRASTAGALQDLCNTQAITPLRVRYTSETTEQVQLAISEALRVLGQCGT
jgi:hypothetical protein